MAIDHAGLQDGAEAWLWAAPAGPVPEPPPDSRVQILPIDKLHWDDVEKLYLRVLQSIVPVQYAKLYGVPGQSQDGIDAYGRLPLDLTRDERPGRHYVVLQSRRVKSLTAVKIRKAVDDFLAGEWAKKSARFYYATSYDLQDTKLDKAIQAQTERLAKLDIELVPWGIQEVSTLLKDHPRLVDEFFGRAWVELACGRDAAAGISHRLTRGESDELRRKLWALYGGVFAAQGTVGLAESGSDFVVLNVVPREDQLSDAGIEPGQDPSETAIARHDDEGYTFIASRLGARRQSLRSARHLLSRHGAIRMAATGEVLADEWIASAKNRLPLVDQALKDDRLLLLVDGIDEWTDAAAAERALGVLEAFLGHTKASALCQ